MRVMAGRRNSGERGSLVASAVVLLLVLNSLFLHPRSVNEGLLGNPQTASIQCTTPSCQVCVFNDRIIKEPYCRLCGQAFAKNATERQPAKPERQELLALVSKL